jgi:hypothetical protein
MTALSVIYSGRIQGQTSGGTAVATANIEVLADGRIRFTDFAGAVQILSPGTVEARLLRTIFTGAGGPTMDASNPSGPFLGAR